MKLVLKADKVIDGTGAEAIINAAVTISGGKITGVGTQTELQINPEDEVDVIEGKGCTILPGFIEMHSHMHCSAEADAYRHVTTESDETLLMRSVQAVRAALTSGVTTMRDLGSKNQVAFSIKQAINDSIIPGPRLLVAGTPITTTGGHCNMFGTEADTKDEMLQAIRGQFKLGADCIKIMSTGGGFTPGTNIRAPQYPVETLAAAVQDAERLNLRVAAHCHAVAGVRNCVEAGVHNLIHCTWLAEDPDKMYDYDTDVADAIADKGLFVDPTLALIRLSQLREPESSPVRQTLERNSERRFEILRDMWDRGVRFVTGMDSGMTHARFEDFAYIPEVMVNNLGISPMEAIVCATQTSADCLGILEQTGTLTPGKDADVVIIKGDPLMDIRALHSVDTIVRQGSVIKRNGVVLV